MPEEFRRATDREDDDLLKEIRQLIINTQDLNVKTQLMIQLRIADSLITNTRITTKLNDKIDTHLDEFGKHALREEKLFAQGRILWRIVVSVVGFLQIVVGYALIDHISKNREQDSRLIEAETWIRVHKNHHEMEEKGLAK